MNETAIAYATEFLRGWLLFRAQETDIPGFSVAVYAGGREVFSQGYGFADTALEVAMTTDHLFGVASQSKMFTATMILQLYERGLVGLDEPVSQFLPWLAHHTDGRFQEITVRQLLTHQAGIVRDAAESDYWLGEGPFPNDEMLAADVQAARLVFDPQSHVKYSNLGYALLGQIIAVVRREKYDKAAVADIIKPLGLEHTYADWRPALARDAATGYTFPKQGIRTPVMSHLSMRAMAAAAGVWASPGDLCRFAAAQFYANDSLLLATLKRDAHRAHARVGEGYDQGYEYGLGFESIRVGDKRLVGHGGSVLGYRSATFFDPEMEIAVSVAANCKDAPVMAMTRGIFGALFHFQNTAQAPTPASLARFNNRLYNGLSAIQVVATHDAVVALDPNDWDPFSWYEQLTQTHHTALRVTTPKSVHSSGEQLNYRFSGGRATGARLGGIPFAVEPSTPILQSANLPTNQQFTLPQKAAEVLFRHYDQQSQSVFRLEVLPEYDMSIEEDDSFSVQSLRAWEQGKLHKAKALMYKARAKEIELPPWLLAQQRRGRITVRVRVVNGDFVPYMQWEREYFKQLNIALGNERILYVSKNYLADAVLPAGDVIICDDVVLVNRYKGSVLTHRTFYDTLHPDGQRLVALKKQILHLAVQYQNQNRE